ncbi:PANK4 [Cordylochernes scorpioides]|uniref:PANK4 n=1 Tax=Cordylochernes scorpioides TaxID=51811 RepID=A0ABY6LES1_9ARAC|nr:PANK4 [Cordylochernes scorpioides]
MTWLGRTPLRLKSRAGVCRLDKEDEMECLIKGCNFLLKNIPDEVFEYRRHSDPEYRFHSADPDVFPYLLVNIGSGVSIMKVESESSYERIAGSAMGGGSFWGLGALLTNAKGVLPPSVKPQGFDELLQLAEQGDHRKVDMLVKDIYGGDYESQLLPGDLIACSFGKAISGFRDVSQASASLTFVKHYWSLYGSSLPCAHWLAGWCTGQQFASADIARSLLYMISNDIGQLACLYAMMHGLKRVYFGGYFLRGHPLSMHSISFAIKYWSKDKVQALFLRHEGYLGAIGAFLKGAEEMGRNQILDTRPKRYDRILNLITESKEEDVTPMNGGQLRESQSVSTADAQVTSSAIATTGRDTMRRGEMNISEESKTQRNSTTLKPNLRNLTMNHRGKISVATEALPHIPVETDKISHLLEDLAGRPRH